MSRHVDSGSASLMKPLSYTYSRSPIGTLAKAEILAKKMNCDDDGLLESHQLANEDWEIIADYSWPRLVHGTPKESDSNST